MPDIRKNHPDSSLPAECEQPIPIARPCYDEAEETAVAAVLRSGWVGQGPQVAVFETVFAEYVGSGHAVAVSSGTSALHLALLAAGIKPGDAVIMPSFTFVATANAIEYIGARPVLADINPTTFNIDPDSVTTALNNLNPDERSSVKAIIPVSLFGRCAPMGKIRALAGQYGWKIIEDAACGLGASHHGISAGREAQMACFSFHPRKVICTGEGGMVTTDDSRVAESVRTLRNHAASVSGHDRHTGAGGSRLPDFEQLGYNYRMTDIQAAIGIEQMKKLPRFLTARREAAAVYYRLLESIPDIKAPVVPEGHIHAYQSYVCLYHPDEALSGRSIDTAAVEKLACRRNDLMDRLERAGIATRQGTHAVHTLAYYRDKYGFKPNDYPASLMADRLSLALPLYCGITPADQERVVAALQDDK